MSKHPKRNNISNEEHVRFRKKEVKKKRDAQLEDLRESLKDPRVRRVFWRILEVCGTFNSIWEPSAKIHYNAGKQDLGHFLMSEITEADSQLLLTMIKENQQQEVNNV